MRLLPPLDMRTQPFLLLPQRLLLLPPDALAAHNHHNRLVTRLLAIRRAARRLLLSLALQRAELFPALAASRNRCHPLLVVRLGLLPRTEDVALRYECRRFVRAGRGCLLGGFERGELPLCCRAAAIFNRFCGSLYSQVVDQCEVGRCENLGCCER